MFFVLIRLLRWSVFFSSVPFQSHIGNIRSSLPGPAGKSRDSFSKNLFYIMIILFLNIYIYLLFLMLFSEYTASAVGCCTLFRGSLAAVYSSSVIISALQTSPHMAAQSQRARRTRCAWVYESLGKVFRSNSVCLLKYTSIEQEIIF